MRENISFLFILLLTAACSAPQTRSPDTHFSATPSPAATSATAPETAPPAPTETRPPPPTQTPSRRTLTVCMGAEPETLYLYGGSMHAMDNILEAIYDGPIDHRGFSFQPVILQKLPSLADGDAVIQRVSVQAGDSIEDANGSVTALTPGVRYHPAGCQSPDCTLVFDQGVIEMDQLIAVFTLLEGLKWSDGQPLTAGDSVFSYQIASQQCEFPWESEKNLCGFLGAGGRATLHRTANYYAVDDRTLYWVGLPGFLDPFYMTNFASPLPEHQLSGYSAQELLERRETRLKPLGWGPYILTEWKTGSYVRLAKNRHYFRSVQGLPHFDSLVFRFTGENSSENIQRLLSGECDLLDIETHLDDAISELITMDKNGLLQAHFSTGTVWEHADFGIQPASYDDGYQIGKDRPDLFSDVRTRRAMAYCMDRQAIADTIFFGKSEVMHSYLPANHPLYNPSAAQYPFDTAAGSALLDEVGWVDHDDDPATPRIARGIPSVPEGTLLKFNFWTTNAVQRRQASQILVNSLAQCGIQADVQYWDPAEFFAEGPSGLLFGRQFDMAQFAWLTGPLPKCDLWTGENIPGEDPRIFPHGWSGWNLTGYKNFEFDRACERASSLLPGQEGFLEAHLLAQEIFARELPVIPLYLRIWVTAAREDFCGFELDPTQFTETWNIESFDYGNSCK